MIARMSSDAETEKQSGSGRGQAKHPEPGVLLVYSAGAPTLKAIPLSDGAIELGRASRGGASGYALDDPVVSRQHARLACDGRRWTVRDLGSRNGTAVDGNTLTGEYVGAAPRVVRVGDSLLVPRDDVRRFRGAAVEVNEQMVMGPTLGEAWQALARAAAAGDTVHLTGESGTGKELAAEAFHRLGPHPGGPFVAVNCAAIPEGVAERLLFGARKGAFSGAAADAEGYLQAAHGGTLYLDEVAELGEPVQAKLLRVIETREVMALGASHARAVDVRICTATHKDLRGEVARGTFRKDLYFRIAQPEIALPPLRDRPCEIPWLVERAIGQGDPPLAPHVSLIEECLLRPWPGNLRELHAELRAAALRARSQHSATVEAMHLSSTAGTRFEKPSSRPSRPRTAVPSSGRILDRAEVEAALRQASGNISAAARALGVHRTQLRRWMQKHHLSLR
jgi:transcriptional regulator with PAS, ATPase and Fis domain